jgi:endoglucanase
MRHPLLLWLVACCLLPASAGAAVKGNPMAGPGWFVDPNSAAAHAQRHAAASGDSAAAAQFDVIARTPQATWFIAADGPFGSYVDRYFARWRRNSPGSVPVIALHGLPHQNCAGDNAPGHPDAAAYRRWVGRWAARIGGSRFVVVLEPDALAASNCLSSAQRKRRLAMLTYAARTLSRLPQTAVYEDAGAGDWRSLRDAARLLKRAGVRYARGFSLNVTHFDWTSAEVAYGRKLSRLVGNKHFLVNTSANGLGPEIGPRNYHKWCNPRGRALGPVPTAQTPDKLVDAFFWIGNPGLSDGSCNGGPTVGTFWVDWARELVRNAARARDYPAFHSRR